MPTFVRCPLCKIDLPPGSRSCDCGWSAREPEKIKPVKLCCHDGCGQPALLVLKLKTGWAETCRFHAEAHRSRDAAEFNRAHGLDTRAKQQAFVRERLGAIGKIRDPRKWARDLLDAHARGERLLPIQIELARRATRQEES